MEAKQPSKIAKFFSESREVSLLIIIALLFIILSITTDTFLKADNLFNIIKQVSIGVVIACGMTFIMGSGGIDLSIANNMCVCSVISALCMYQFHFPVFLACLVSLALGALIGAFNGVIITQLGLAPFIVTMATQNICNGIGLVITKGYPVTLEKNFVYTLGQSSIAALGGFPYLGLCIPICVVIAWFVISKTVIGSRIKATGGNAVAAQLSGINTVKIRILAYIIGGLFAGFAGIMLTGRLNAGNPSGYGTYGMDAIAATIVGGTSMAGGGGNIFGTFMGAILMQTLRNGLVLLQVSMYWQTIVIGILLIAICSLDTFTQKIRM